MSATIIQAAAALAEALEAENDALRSMDVPRALSQFPSKVECSRRLQLALAEQAALAGQAGSDPSAAAPQARATALAYVTHLQALSETNRRLLERAMAVQGRLIAILARAVPAPRVGYGPAALRTAPAAPMTLSARV